jgi:hypothetical protein
VYRFDLSCPIFWASVSGIIGSVGGETAEDMDYEGFCIEATYFVQAA